MKIIQVKNKQKISKENVQMVSEQIQSIHYY
jgi:hypothetical protein